VPVEHRRRPPRRKPQQVEQRVVELPEMNLNQRITLLIAERMRLAGFQNVQAAAPGYEAPLMIKGAHKDHRPNVATQFKTGVPLLVDVYTPEQDGGGTTESRWQLFSSAAEMSGGQFHVATPEIAGPRSAASDAVKKDARSFDVTIHKIWEV
jgi:hypothetical protein